MVINGKPWFQVQHNLIFLILIAIPAKNEHHWLNGVWKSPFLWVTFCLNHNLSENILHIIDNDTIIWLVQNLCISWMVICIQASYWNSHIVMLRHMKEHTVYLSQWKRLSVDAPPAPCPPCQYFCPKVLLAVILCVCGKYHDPRSNSSAVRVFTNWQTQVV